MKVVLTHGVAYYATGYEKVSNVVVPVFAPLRENFLQCRGGLNEVSFMFWLKSIGVLLLVSLLLISVMARTQKMHRIATGVWGGEHIRIEVGTKSATIEYDCATGVIEGPLVVDSKGEFNLR